MLPVTLDPAKLLDDIATLKKRLEIEHAARIASEKRAADAEARATGLAAELHGQSAEIEALKLTIAKMRRDKFGASSERGTKLLDQLELQLAELEEGMAEDKAAAAIAAPPATATGGQRRRRAAPKARSSPAPQSSSARARRACGAVLLSRLRRELEEAR